jgi:hypothetical protein
METINSVSIALQPSVYSTFRALNNTVSFALGEYVDNAVQSYLDNKDALVALDPNYRLEIRINVDWEKRNITITDNAAGINTKNYKKAFEPAHIPLDSTGLNEFGMGMKTASVWLADKWCIYTKALGETVERFTNFDLLKVIEDNKEELIVEEKPKSAEEHYTKIILTDLSKQAPSVNQMDKVKRHLSSFYRKFIKNEDVKIFVNEELLHYPEYEILNAPYYKQPESHNIFWKKEIDFQIGKYKATGFIAILKTMQQSANGIALLRRGRIIEEKYFPQIICGQAGSPRYKRIFGEIELEGFDVSFNKNKFRDEEDLSIFMEALKEELTQTDFDLYGQAENYRQRTKEEVTKIAKEITKKLKKENKTREFTKKIQEVELKAKDTELITREENIIQEAEVLSSHSDSFTLGNTDYSLKIELVNTNSNNLYSINVEDSKSLFDDINSKTISCRINLAHPFFARFDMFKKNDNYQPIITIFRTLTLAEIIAVNRKIGNASIIRILFNEHLL